MSTIKARADSLYEEFIAKLHAEQYPRLSIARRAEAAIGICEDYLRLSKEIVQQHQFADEPEEIYFFKMIKPKFISEHIYYSHIFRIHTTWPVGTEKEQLNFLQRELKAMHAFFYHHQPFYTYYRSNSDHLDRLYFLRGNYHIKQGLDHLRFELDTSFCTNYDGKLSRTIAIDRLQQTVTDYIKQVKKSNRESGQGKETTLTWTDSKTALVELLYALHSQGSFNKGNADIKEIASLFEKAFNIQMGEFYRIWTEIRLRKTGRTKFLDAIKVSLERRIDEVD